MKFVQEIAVGVGIAPDIVVYAAAQNKHLLLGKLPEPKQFEVYREQKKDLTIFYFIDKKVVVLWDKKKKVGYSIDLKTGEKYYLPARYVERFRMNDNDAWKLRGKGSLIICLARAGKEIFKIKIYNRDIPTGIRILEDYLQDIEKLFRIFRAGHRDISLVTIEYYDHWKLELCFWEEQPLVVTPQGYRKVETAEVDLIPEAKLKVFLKEQAYPQQNDTLLMLYPDGVSLEELAKIIAN